MKQIGFRVKERHMEPIQGMNEKVVRIEGDPESSIRRGTLCPKGIATIQLAYHPDRLLYPQQRKGAKGEGQWAAREGIEEGDWVIIESVRGRCRQRAKLTLGIDPRVIGA